MQNNELGWTFLETLIVLAIMLILTSAVSFTGIKYLDKAKVTATNNSIASLKIALESYYMDTGLYPTESQGLKSLWERPNLEPVSRKWDGPYVESSKFEDAWGNPFIFTTDSDFPYRIISYGADNLPGGDSYKADIASSEER
jgi:general secretion pathway protein G